MQKAKFAKISCLHTAPGSPPPRAHAAVTSDDHGPPLERRSDSFSIFTFGYRLRRTTEYIGEQMGMCRETLRRAFELRKQTWFCESLRGVSEQLPPPHITKPVMPWLSNSVLASTPEVLAAAALMDLAGAPMDWDSVACQGQTARGWKHCSFPGPSGNDSCDALFSQARGAGLDWRRVVPGAAERY